MSTFQPEGITITINGEDRNLMWDYAVIEKVQDKWGVHPIFAIRDMFWADKDEEGNEYSHYKAKTIIDLLHILLNTEVGRRKFFDGMTSLRTYTREEIGYLVTRQNQDEIVSAITKSWVDSTPEAEPEEPDDEEDIDED